MALVYVEYKTRLPGVELALFHEAARQSQGWNEEHPDDILLLNIGRTWRLGPEPAYLSVYYSPRHGLERLADWDGIFMAGEANHLEVRTRLSCRIDAAGCYLPLLEPQAGQQGPYYAEYFDVLGGATADDVAALFRSRAEAAPERTLHLLCDRIGKLGPEPRGIAVWGLPGLNSLAAVAAESDNGLEPVRVVSVGVYENIGREIL